MISRTKNFTYGSHKCRLGDEAVSPIVATLILIVVAIIGGAAVALIMGSFSSSVSNQANTGNTVNSASAQILIADSSYTYPVDLGLTKNYSMDNPGVVVTPQLAPSDSASITAVGENVADIAATSESPNAAELARYPDLQSYFVGGRAVVIIAHSGAVNATSVTNGEMLYLYDNNTYTTTSGTSPPFGNSIKSVVRDTSNDGCEEIFANWLTEGYASNLNSYTITPSGVTMYNETSEAAVLSYINSTPNSIGYIDYAFLENNMPSAANVVLIPVINEENGQMQTPTPQSIQAEILNMNNNNYDAGLCRQLYYITNSQPDSLVSNYINWALEPASTSAFGSIGEYSATNLGLPTNMVTTTGTSEATRTITDFMTLANGNIGLTTLSVPLNVTRVVSAQPITTFMVWRLAPQDLLDIDSVLKPRMANGYTGSIINMNNGQTTIPYGYNWLDNLPYVSAMGATPDQVLPLQGQVLVVVTKDSNVLNGNYQSELNMPIVQVCKDNITDFGEDWQIIGQLVGNESGAITLANFWNNTIAYVQSNVTQAQAATGDTGVNAPKVIYWNTNAGTTISTSTCPIAGSDTVFASEIRMAGGQTYWDDNSGSEIGGMLNTSESITTSDEAVQSWGVQVILVNSQGAANQIEASGSPWYAYLQSSGCKVYVVPEYETMDCTQACMGMEWAAISIWNAEGVNLNMNFNNDAEAYYQLYENDTITPTLINTPSP
jgi:phosphate transport system substrate-binding protein